MRQIKEIQNRLNNADWIVEYCHPHNWSDRDMDGCMYRLNKAHFSLAEVSEAVSENLDEIIAEVYHRDGHSFIDVASEYIADQLAWRKLQKSTCTWPESATFSLTLQ